MTHGPAGGNLRVAVVGVGKMGQNHARCLSSMKGVDLVAVVDTDRALAESVAASRGSRAVDSIDDLHGVEAVVVAVPTAQHAEIGCELMKRGIHCLVEKPLAGDSGDARLLLNTAEAVGVVLQVGHVERFNPAVRQLREVLADERVLAVNARRMSATSGRVTDIDVVMDLMIHDFDVVLSLMGGDTPTVVARGVDGTSGHDHVTALLSFDDQRMASITASRITQNQIRQLEVITEERFFTVDYSNQDLVIYRQGRVEGHAGNEAEVRYSLDVDIRQVFVRRREPLVEELEHFVGAVRGDHPCEVDGPEALRALELVWAVQDELRRGRLREPCRMD